MKKILLIGALCSLLCVSACTDQGNPNASAEPTTEPTPVTTTAPTPSPAPSSKIITASEDSKIGEGWSKVGSYGYDIDSDGTEENISLCTSAKKNKNGEFMWDDSQQWVLEVTDGIETFTLFDEYLPLGNIYFEVADYYDEEGNEIPCIMLVESSSTNFTVIRYTFNSEENTFAENIVFNSDNESSGGINQRYSSFPTIE